jgi:hypothetical protein
MLRLVVILCCLLPLCGCRTNLPVVKNFGWGEPVVTTTSQSDSAVTIETGPLLAVYRPTSIEAADIYLTDIPERLLTKPDGLSRAEGSIVHVHLFLEPRAGRTPVANTACNVAVRHIVLARAHPGDGDSAKASRVRVGEYAGGGFAKPRDDIGDDPLRATITGATLRLVRADEGFRDLLGPATLKAVFKAKRDDALAEAIAARVQEIRSAQH